MRKLTQLLLSFLLLGVWQDDLLASSGYSYSLIYEDKISEIKISPENENKVKCFEVINDIVFDSGQATILRIDDDTASFRYSGLQETIMSVHTPTLTYKVRLIPDKKAPPMVIVARSTFKQENIQYLTADGLNRAYISNKEINRITCDDGNARVKNIILPKNSGIIKEKDAGNAYIQYKGTDDVVIHISTTTGKVYSVSLRPSDVEAKTLILKNSGKVYDKISGGNSWEEKTVDLIKTAVTDISSLIDAKISTKAKKIVTLDYKNATPVEVIELARYQFPPNGVLLVEYRVKSKDSIDGLDEAFFYDHFFKGVNTYGAKTVVIGMGLSSDYVTPGKPTSLFVVYRSQMQ